MKALGVSAFVVLALVSAALPLSAHHSWPVSYDKLVTVKGTLLQFTWANPHPMMTLEVQADDGRTEKWQIGGPAINRMEANGWTRSTVKAGDVITGPKSTTYDVKALRAGTYFFRCDVHPTLMTGSLVVK